MESCRGHPSAKAQGTTAVNVGAVCGLFQGLPFTCVSHFNHIEFATTVTLVMIPCQRHLCIQTDEVHWRALQQQIDPTPDPRWQHQFDVVPDFTSRESSYNDNHDLNDTLLHALFKNLFFKSQILWSVWWCTGLAMVVWHVSWTWNNFSILPPLFHWLFNNSRESILYSDKMIFFLKKKRVNKRWQDTETLQHRTIFTEQKKHSTSRIVLWKKHNSNQLLLKVVVNGMKDKIFIYAGRPTQQKSTCKSWGEDYVCVKHGKLCLVNKCK